MRIIPVENYGSGMLARRDHLFSYNEKTDAITFYVDPDPMVMREKINTLKECILSLGNRLDEMKVEHILSNGTYTRKLHIPKGMILVGKIHLKECVNIVAKGDISILTETGSKRCQAGYTVVSPAGMQKVGYAHEDTIFINVFRTDETDVKKIEREIATETFEAFDALTLDMEYSL